jgi:DNA polymerase-3 subunit delta'
MSLHPVVGHTDERALLARAVLAGELPGSILIHGPAGIGKQRLGLWLAQRILCEKKDQLEPCGECRNCRLALRLEHPDLHWFFPILRPKGASGPEKLADAMEETRANELAARREDPLLPVTPGEPVGLYMGQVLTIRRAAVTRPSMGDHKIFIIGDAELLASQEASQEAANALLKLLEEPPVGTTFILTASDADALVPTLRSRLLPVRLRALPEEDVADFLVRARAANPNDARLAARLAQGSIGRALAFLRTDSEEEAPLETLREHARLMLEAAADGSPERRLASAHALPPTGARGAFGDILEMLALWLRDLAATAAGAEELVVNTDSHTLLRKLAQQLPAATRGLPRAIRAIDEARLLGRNNVNPQLTLAWLLNSIHMALVGG